MFSKFLIFSLTGHVYTQEKEVSLAIYVYWFCGTVLCECFTLMSLIDSHNQCLLLILSLQNWQTAPSAVAGLYIWSFRGTQRSWTRIAVERRGHQGMTPTGSFNTFVDLYLLWDIFFYCKCSNPMIKYGGSVPMVKTQTTLAVYSFIVRLNNIKVRCSLTVC